MHYETVTGECHEAVGLVMWVNLVSSNAIVDVIFFDVTLAKEGIRLLSNFVTTACFSAEVCWDAWMFSFLNVVVGGNRFGKG